MAEDRSAATTAPRERLLDDVWVGNLPRRVAHAVHAILEGSGPYAHGMGVLTAAEIMLYDAEAVSPRSTAAALSIAQRRYQLVGYVGKGLWIPTNRAYNLRAALEARYLRDTGDETTAAQGQDDERSKNEVSLGGNHPIQVVVPRADVRDVLAEIERFTEALQAIESMTGAAGAGQIPAMPVARRAREALDG